MGTRRMARATLPLKTRDTRDPPESGLMTKLQEGTLYNVQSVTRARRAYGRCPCKSRQVTAADGNGEGTIPSVRAPTEHSRSNEEYAGRDESVERNLI